MPSYCKGRRESDPGTEGVDLSKYTWFDNALDMAANEDLDIVVELMEGQTDSKGFCRDRHNCG